MCTRPSARLCLQVELHQENNAYLSYWLSNTVTLLYLMQKNIKPASGGGYAARLKASGQQMGQQVGVQAAVQAQVAAAGAMWQQGEAGFNK